MKTFKAKNNTEASANTDLTGVLTLSVSGESIKIPADDFVEISDYLLKKRNRWRMVGYAAGLLFFIAVAGIALPEFVDVSATNYLVYLIGGSFVLAVIGKIGEKF